MFFIKIILKWIIIILYVGFMIIRISSTTENEKIKAVINLIMIAVGILMARYLFK